MIQSHSVRSIALLIDGDNAQPKTIGKIIREVSKYGAITIRKIYGDWTQPNMQSWKPVLHLHAIQPIQQFRIVSAKNTTDNAMIIDTMDILHQKSVAGFCIVSSDSDFTRLATRIREDNLFVIGVGREETHKAFQKSCNHFIAVENLLQPPATPPVLPAPTEKVTPTPPAKTVTAIQQPKALTKQQKNLLKLFKQAFAEVGTEDGWVLVNKLGSQLRQCDSTFKPTLYGSSTLSKLIKLYPEWFITRGKGNTLAIRLKNV